LRVVAQVEPIVGVVSHIAAVSVGVRTPDGGFTGGRSPNGFVTDFGDFRQTLVDLVPRGFEILDDDLGLTQTGEDRKKKAG
jgi:hypothetical protein